MYIDNKKMIFSYVFIYFIYLFILESLGWSARQVRGWQ